MNAWKAACQAKPNDRSILVIPEGKTFLLKPISFSGPCKPSGVYVQVSTHISWPLGFEIVSKLSHFLIM
ncbi:putative endo-polygalacturonase [Helianthus anomalus]